jgi:L-seryl-tRNA(Ser) seleniumtransferase
METIAQFLRNLPKPVLGRIARGRLLLDCRCLEQADEAAFIAQITEAGNTA